jgi:hypothetical protein
MGPPDADVVLGAGVSSADELMMRSPGSDAYLTNVGSALDVAGVAVRGADAKRFHWSFRRVSQYRDCALSPTDPATAGVTLRSNDALTYDLRVEVEAIFRDDVDPAAASLRFDPFAAADSDGDGAVTLAELASIPVAMSATTPTGLADGNPETGGLAEAGIDHALDAASDVVGDGKIVPPARAGHDAASFDDTGVIATLADYVYQLLVPSIPRFRDTGYCTVSARRRFD